MHRTIKLPFTPLDPSFEVELADLRRRQSRAIRTAYSRLGDGTPVKELYPSLRSHPTGKGLHTWLLLSGISKAKALLTLRPDGKAVFGGRKSLIARAEDKMTRAEWRAKRLWPLVIEGHARSYGSQGGNHLVSLDLARAQLTFHGSRDFVLQLRLSDRSRSYWKRLGHLQARCETLRDTPFSVSIGETELTISWNDKPLVVAGRTNVAKRVLSLDLNPSRVGWTVVEKGHGFQCSCVAWGIFDYPDLNRRLRLSSDDPRSVALNDKRHHELAILAKKLQLLARHYGADTVVTERLNLGHGDFGRGRRFNRLVNQCWFKTGLLQPLKRRLEESGLRHAEVNPAYSSMIGNHLWAESLRIPDPACAALELGRRFFFPLPFTQNTRIDPLKPNADRQWKDGRRDSEKSASLGGWTRVWRHLNSTARDTPRRTRKHVRGFLPFGFPRRPSIQEQRSHVLHFDPGPGTSDFFGFDFSLLLAG